MRSRTLLQRSSLVAFALLVVTGAQTAAEDWPAFRGPTGMGISTEAGLPLEWSSDGKNVLWKAPLASAGREAASDHNQSSPIVWQDRVVVTAAVWPTRDKQEIPRQHVTCYRVKDGQQLWDTQVPAGPWRLTDLRGGYAAPTPVADRRGVYVVFGSSVLAALDWSGQIVWRKELPDWQAFDVAIASSPILVRGQLLVLADRNQKKSTLTAFDPATGDVLWEQKRPQGAFTHTTPVLIDQRGQPQLLVTASHELQALDPATGERLWWCKTPGDVTSPVFARGMIYTDSGRGGPGLLVDGSGQGDVAATHVRWRLDQIPEGLSSPLIVGDYLYRLHNPGVLKCVDIRDGHEAYATRLAGVSVASSPVATADGRIYCASGGKSFVINSGPTFKLLATNDLGEACSASPAVSQGRLFLKGQRHLFCIGVE